MSDGRAVQARQQSHTAIELSGLTKTFGRLGRHEVAVDGIDLSVEEGEFLTLVGPSGCGKTTTLRCIAGLERPTAGTIRFGGTDVTDLPSNERNTAMMFQNIALFPHMTVRENIAYPLRIRNVDSEHRAAQVADAASLMQISSLLENHPGELSGGQRQRVALARTLVQDPVAFLLDEPLSDLDANLKVDIEQEIQRVHRRIGRPTVYVTHDQGEAMKMSDRIAVMNMGRIEQLGTPDEIYHAPVNRFVAGFIGNPSMNFLAGTVEAVRTGSLDLVSAFGRIEVAVEGASSGHSLADRAVAIGIRPHELRLAEGDRRTDAVGEVQLVEPLGDRTIVTATVDDTRVRATVDAETSLTEGDPIGLSIAGARLHLFDTDTGAAIARGRPS